jgi:hypothetical protein
VLVQAERVTTRLVIGKKLSAPCAAVLKTAMDRVAAERDRAVVVAVGVERDPGVARSRCAEES